MDEYIYNVKEDYRSNGSKPTLYKAKVVKRTAKTVRIDRHDESAYGFGYAMVMHIDSDNFFNSPQDALRAYINKNVARAMRLESEASAERENARLANKMLLELSISVSHTEIQSEAV